MESEDGNSVSPREPYRGEKKAWKHQLLDMEEVFTETPMFKERTRVVEQVRYSFNNVVDINSRVVTQPLFRIVFSE
jgi:hypothetical protein